MRKGILTIFDARSWGCCTNGGKVGQDDGGFELHFGFCLVDLFGMAKEMIFEMPLKDVQELDDVVERESEHLILILFVELFYGGGVSIRELSICYAYRK